MKKLLLNPWTALITLALVLGIRISDTAFVESVRLRYFDTLITSKAPTENNIYTVNIDEATLDKYGQWPLPRGQYAELIDELFKRNAGLVVWTILMPELDRNGQDNDLSYALATNPVILSSVPSNTSKNPPRQVGASIMRPEFTDRIVQYPGMISNIEALSSQAAGVGIAGTLPEVDGVNRRLPLVVSVNDVLYPSVSLETLRVAAGDPSFQIKLNENGVEKMRIPQFGPIATDNLGRIWIDWSQRSQSVSAAKLPKDFNKAIVIVGTSAAGLGNPVPTSIGAVWPQDVHASVIGTMVNGVTIQRPDYADGLEILAILAAGVILLALTRWVYVGLASVVVLVGGFAYGSYYAFATDLWLFDVTAPIAGVILVALHAYGVKFVSEFLQKQQIKKQFGSYVSPVIVERLQKDPSLIKLGGEEKMLTAVMTDMRNFTGLGEKYGADVEGFTAIMNAYMTAISKPVFANDGCLIKFIGDASLHIHGAPVDDNRHAYRAVKTAIEMVQAVDEFNKHLHSIGKPPVGMGAGVNTGKILVGNIGSEGKMGYDVLGDPVSVASRLEGQTKGYGVLLIIGPDTYAEVKNDFHCFELDCIAVKGKDIGLNIYTPLFNPANFNQHDADRHASMLAAYRAQDWRAATAITKSLIGCFGGELDHYYELWLERIAATKKMKLPTDWDGIYRATSK
jgi:adenylate cyclase